MTPTTGKYVHVYRNIHTQCFSVKYKGLVIDHMDSILLSDAHFVVSKPGRARVLQSRTKNVHATVRGTAVDSIRIKIGQEIRYNPYKAGHFFYRCNGKAIHSAELVLLNDNRIYLAERL